jgi:hypothetical protein
MFLIRIYKDIFMLTILMWLNFTIYEYFGLSRKLLCETDPVVVYSILTLVTEACHSYMYVWLVCHCSDSTQVFNF